MSLVIQKAKVPDAFQARLEELSALSEPCVRRMLANRGQTSSKHYKELPCVLAKSLITKYQRNPKCQQVQNENHRTSKAIVAYAQAHCRAIAIEDLSGVTAKGSKIKGYTQKSQWAFGQLETFLRYKACLAGVPLIEVDPAYSSQTCSRCGERHKPIRKVFECPSCLVKQHRDANSGFVIAKRGNEILNGVGSGVENVAPFGPLGGPVSGKEVVYAR